MEASIVDGKFGRSSRSFNDKFIILRPNWPAKDDKRCTVMMSHTRSDAHVKECIEGDKFRVLGFRMNLPLLSQINANVCGVGLGFPIISFCFDRRKYNKKILNSSFVDWKCGARVSLGSALSRPCLSALTRGRIFLWPNKPKRIIGLGPPL